MGTRSGVGAALVALGLISSAQANVINLLTNGGLEEGSATLVPGERFATATPISNNTALPGWTIVSGSVDIVPNSDWQAAEGTYSVDMVGTPGLGVISQQVSTTAGAGYTLTFELSANPQVGRGINETGTTKRLLVEALAADGVTVLSSQTFPISVGTRTPTHMQYLSESLDFTATGGTSTLRLSALTPLNLPRGLTAANIYTGPVVDNLVLQLSAGNPRTPEPASLEILGAGGAAMLFRGRRRGWRSALIFSRVT